MLALATSVSQLIGPPDCGFQGCQIGLFYGFWSGVFEGFEELPCLGVVAGLLGHQAQHDLLEGVALLHGGVSRTDDVYRLKGVHGMVVLGCDGLDGGSRSEPYAPAVI